LLKRISREGLGIWRYIATYSRFAIYAIVLVALLTGVMLWSLRALIFEENFHAVIPHEIYRSAQPSPVTLERWIQDFGLRSVVNLRGERAGPLFKDEQAVTKSHGADYYAIALNNCKEPPGAALLQLVDILDTARRPLFLHCALGIERSGLASAVALLLAGEDITEARKQFTLNYGFVPFWDDHPKVLDDYEHWLAMQGWFHTPDRFRYWVKNEYCNRTDREKKGRFSTLATSENITSR
jgi:protein tyrosine phosphatase (PTP) superfamily phosphohydrolase (DUF442 family)